MATDGLFRAVILLAVTLAATPTRAVETPQEKPSEVVFDLNEIAVFQIEDDRLRAYFSSGQWASCREDPCSTVKTYPALVSQKPLYGSIRFPRQDAFNRSGVEYVFALDESKGTGTGYDRLFFDGNRNRDLTDDTPLVPQTPPPIHSIQKWKDIEQQVIFSCLSIAFEGGHEGKSAIELMPHLIITDKGYKTLSFVTTKAHAGQIEISGRKYEAYLGHGRFVSGCFDRPMTALRLVPSDPSEQLAEWIWGDRLMAIHKIAGRYWQFAATPAGDRLTVKPYPKAIGTFEISSGGRHLKEATISGVLRSQDGTVAVGGPSPHVWPEPNQSCQLPEGDYQPVLLSAQYGPLRMHIEPNCFGDGKGWDLHPSDVYGIQIRRDRPFVLDFSNKPVVLFASPASAARVKRGDTVDIHALLIDPKLDIGIGDIHAMPQERISTVYTLVAPILFIAGLAWLVVPRLPRELRPIGVVPIFAALLLWCWLGFLSYMNAETAKVYSPHPQRLEPAVVIVRADGQVVAKGGQPFSWPVPVDLALKADQEVFTINVTFDTLDLYGKVRGTRQVTVFR